MNTYLSIITLNANELNAPIKKTQGGLMDNKTRPLHILSIRNPQVERHRQTENKEMKEDIS